jgi:hypothetical protein
LERGYLLLQFLPLFHRRPKSLLRLRSALQYAVCARIRDRVLWMLSKKRRRYWENPSRRRYPGTCASIQNV